MDTQTIQQKIQASELSDETKKKILAILGDKTELTIEENAEIKELIHADMKADLRSAGITGQEPEFQSVDLELDHNLSEVDSEFDMQMKEIDSELTELDEMRKNVAKAEDANKIADLQAKLKQ